MHIYNPGCSFRKVGIKCDWFADTINYTHMFDELPYHLVKVLGHSSLLNHYVQWIFMIKRTKKLYIIMVLHYFGYVGARASVVVRVALTQTLKL